jgi:hypothetical protein
MSAIQLATPSDVTVGMSNIGSSKVVYYLVYDFTFNDYAAAVNDSDLPATGDSLSGFGVCRSKQVVEELTPNAAVVACRFDLRGYGQWIGKPRPYARTVSRMPEVVEVPRYVKRKNTSNTWDYSPLSARRVNSIYIVSKWVTADAVAVQLNADNNAGKLVTGIRGATYPTHRFIGAECVSDGNFTKVDYTFEAQSEIIIPSGLTGTDKWFTDITPIPSLRPFETYAHKQAGAGAGETPKVFTVPTNEIYGDPTSVESITGAFS